MVYVIKAPTTAMVGRVVRFMRGYKSKACARWYAAHWAFAAGMWRFEHFGSFVTRDHQLYEAAQRVNVPAVYADPEPPRLADGGWL